MKTNSKPWDHLRVCGAVLAPATGRSAGWGSSPRVRSGPFPPFRKRLSAGIISACAERSWNPGLGIWRARDHLRVCGAVYAPNDTYSCLEGSSPRVRSGQRLKTAATIRWGIISACAERSVSNMRQTFAYRDHLRVCGAVGGVITAAGGNLGSSPRVRSGRIRGILHPADDRIISACAERSGIISACAERSVVFYWDLVRLDGAECLIRTLCGVVEWRCSRYLEWMLSIYVTRASRPRIWGVLVVAGFRKSSERSRALTRRVAPRMNVFLSIIGLIDDRDTITLWGRRYPLGAYPKVDGIRLINEATKGGAHVFHCFVAAY